jgi:2-phosphoglycerate kinase
MTKRDPRIQQIFSRAFILGGSPCSGKSTIAEKVSTNYHMPYYKVDDHFQDHLNRCNPKRHPTMHRIVNLSWNEIWSQPVSLQVREELVFYHEQFELILQDLKAYPTDKPIIIEGAALLPDLIHTQDVNSAQALYLIPTKEFQVRHYAQRAWIHHILKDCDDPDRAFENWMQRDHLFGQEILQQAKNFGYRIILVDGRRNIQSQFQKVCQIFGLKKPDPSRIRKPKYHH